MGWGAAFFTSATAICFAVLAVLFVCGVLWAVLGWARLSRRVQANPALRTMRFLIGGGCLVLCLCFAWLSFTYAWLNYNFAHAAERFSVVPAAAANAPGAAVPGSAQSAP